MAFAGADPTRAENESESAVDFATEACIDVRLLLKFLDYVPDAYINSRDHISGDTLLHHAIKDCDSNTIIRILKKGADVTLKNSASLYNEEGIYEKKICELPLEFAVGAKKGMIRIRTSGFLDSL